MTSDHEAHGFRPVGSLLPKTPNSPRPSDSSLPTSPPSSATTGALSPAARGSSLTGRPPSEIAAVKWQDVRRAVEEEDADQVRVAVERLLKPLEASCLKSTIGAEGDLDGYELIGSIAPALVDRLEKMARYLTRPSRREVVIMHATRCFSVTKSRAYEVDDMKITLAVLADELSEFPPEIVAAVFKSWARRDKWAPSLAELRDFCQREMRWRRSLLAAVIGAGQAQDPGNVAEPLPSWQRDDPWHALWQRAESPIERHACVLIHRCLLFRANANAYRFEIVKADAIAREQQRCVLVFSQVEIADCRLDFLIAAYDARTDSFRRLAVECDSHEFHGELAKQRKDRERDTVLRQTTGLRVLRLSGKQIVGRPQETAIQIETAMLPGPDGGDPWMPWSD